MWTQFSIRNLLGFVLASAVSVMFLAHWINNPLDQLHSANAQLIPIGYSDLPFCMFYPMVDSAEDVEMVSLERQQCNKRQFNVLRRLTNLKRLDLRGDFPSEWLKSLVDCPNIETLILHGKTDEAHLDAIAEIGSLKSLILSNCYASEGAGFRFEQQRRDIVFDCNYTAKNGR